MLLLTAAYHSNAKIQGWTWTMCLILHERDHPRHDLDPKACPQVANAGRAPKSMRMRGHPFRPSRDTLPHLQTESVIWSHLSCQNDSRMTFLFQGSRLLLVPAVEQAHNLTIIFQLPSLMDRYLAKAEEYVSSLVGHEGKGSLLSLLKARGWATELFAGVPDGGSERNTGVFLFNVTVTLTEAGLKAHPGSFSSAGQLPGLACSMRSLLLSFPFLCNRSVPMGQMM